MGCIFQTTIDSEVIAYVIARERLHCHSIEEAVARTLAYHQGRLFFAGYEPAES